MPPARRMRPPLFSSLRLIVGRAFSTIGGLERASPLGHTHRTAYIWGELRLKILALEEAKMCGASLPSAAKVLLDLSPTYIHVSSNIARSNDAEIILPLSRGSQIRSNSKAQYRQRQQERQQSDIRATAAARVSRLRFRRAARFLPPATPATPHPPTWGLETARASESCLPVWSHRCGRWTDLSK